MSKKEMILALQLILEDIRSNWAYKLDTRTEIALELASELSKEEDIYLKMVDSIKEFQEEMNTEWCDGRHFRTSFPYGYECMSGLHGLEDTYNDKSQEFKKIMECLTHPEYRFSDWE